MKVWVLQTTNYECVGCDNIRIFEDEQSCMDSLDIELKNLPEDCMQSHGDNEVKIYRKDNIDHETILHFQFGQLPPP